MVYIKAFLIRELQYSNFSHSLNYITLCSTVNTKKIIFFFNFFLDNFSEVWYSTALLLCLVGSS